MGRFYLFFIALFLITSCNRTVKSLTLADTESISEIATVRSPKKEICDCNDPNNYAPNPEYPILQDIKYIRTNFHFPNDSTGSKNFTGEEALLFAKNLLGDANRKISKNQKMHLPEGNDTPVYDAGYRYLLMKDKSTPTGYAIYEEVDNENWYYIRKGKGKNNYSRAIVKRHEKDSDQVMNIFAMAYPPDSLKSKTFKSGSAGIALGTSLKIAGTKQTAVDGAWKISALLNHEIGHVFGLRHSWYKSDGCNDTPVHPNCWNKAPTGECAGVTSNNMMDYNIYQMAITPCQIGIVKKNMHKESSKTRGLILKDWCTYDPEKNLVITDDVVFDRSIDMKGDIIVQNGGSLRLSCRIHMPAGAKIIVHPKAKLILNGTKIHNDCGEQWDGIELLSSGKNTGTIKYLGKVELLDLKDEKNTNE